MRRIGTRTRPALGTLVVGAVIVLTLSSCDWAMSGFSAARTSNNSAESKLTTANVGQLSTLFSTMLSTNDSLSPYTATHIPPAVAGGRVFVAGETGGLSVYGADGKTGCSGDLTPACDTPVWRAVVPATTQRSSPTVVDGTVYLGSSDGTVYAFDATGATNCTTQNDDTVCTALRTYAAGGPVATSPAVVGGVLYVTAGPAGRTLYAFDATGATNCSGTPTSCAPLWSADLGGVASDPTIAGGRVYVGAGDGTVSAFDAAGVTNCTGSPVVCTPLWTATLAGASTALSTPAYMNGVLYATATDGRLYAVTATGTPSWRSAVSTRATAPAAASGIVYSATPTGVQAFDATGHTGCAGTPKICSPLFTATGVTAGTPAVANGVLYVSEFAGSLKAFDATGTVNCSGTPKTCQPVWDPGVRPTSPPVVANGTVYVRTDDRTGCCLYRNLLAYAVVPPQIAAASFFFADGQVPIEGIGFPHSVSAVATVTDLDQSNEVVTKNFTTGSAGTFYAVEVTLPVWACGDHISATVTAGGRSASDEAVLTCPGP